MKTAPHIGNPSEIIRREGDPGRRLERFEEMILSASPTDRKSLLNDFLRTSEGNGNILLGACRHWISQCGSGSERGGEIAAQIRTHLAVWGGDENFRKRLFLPDWPDFLANRGCAILNFVLFLGQFRQKENREKKNISVLGEICRNWNGEAESRPRVVFEGIPDTQSPEEILAGLIPLNPQYADLLCGLRDLCRQWLSNGADLQAECTCRFPIFFESRNQGYIGDFVVDRFPAEESVLYPDLRHMAFIPLDASFEGALAKAWESIWRTGNAPEAQIRWRLEHLPQLRGNSAGVMLVGALACARAGLSTPDELHIGGSASIDAENRLQPVGGIDAKYRSFTKRLEGPADSGTFIVADDPDTLLKLEAVKDPRIAISPCGSVEEASALVLKIQAARNQTLIDYLRKIKAEYSSIRGLIPEHTIPFEEILIPPGVNTVDPELTESPKEPADLYQNVLHPRINEPEMQVEVTRDDGWKARPREVVVWGEPGTGKSTLMRVLAVHAAHKCLIHLEDGKTRPAPPLPILVDFREPGHTRAMEQEDNLVSACTDSTALACKVLVALETGAAVLPQLRRQDFDHLSELAARLRGPIPLVSDVYHCAGKGGGD